MGKLITRTFVESKVTIKRASTGEVINADYKVSNLPLDNDKAVAKASRAYNKETKEFDFLAEVTTTETILGMTQEEFKKHAEKVVRPDSQTKKADPVPVDATPVAEVKPVKK